MNIFSSNTFPSASCQNPSLSSLMSLFRGVQMRGAAPSQHPLSTSYSQALTSHTVKASGSLHPTCHQEIHRQVPCWIQGTSTTTGLVFLLEKRQLSWPEAFSSSDATHPLGATSSSPVNSMTTGFLTATKSTCLGPRIHFWASSLSPKLPSAIPQTQRVQMRD